MFSVTVPSAFKHTIKEVINTWQPLFHSGPTVSAIAPDKPAHDSLLVHSFKDITVNDAISSSTNS